MDKTDNPLLGITYITISVFFITAAAAFAKWLYDYHAIELVFYRCVFVLLAVCLFITHQKKWELIKTTRMRSHIGRATVGTIGIILGLAAVQILPLADATTLSFTGPLFVVLLSYPLLKEKVGIYKLSAVVIGFLGVLLVAKPSGEVALIGISLALGAAFFNALVQIYLRDLGKTENPITTVFYFMLYGAIITGVMLPFVWTGPSWESIAFILAMAVCSGTQQIIKTKGHQIAPVAVTAPFDYTALIWATLFGFIFWDTLPTWSVIWGAIIIVFSNIIILWREQRRKQS
ncbi:MAG: DMT family transporter [Pseudomonadota bacterium]